MAGWERTVKAMQKRGARINDDEAKSNINYLTERK
jgi:hypothetical protein